MKQSVKLKKLNRRREKLQWDLQKLEAKVESFQKKVKEKIRDTKQDVVSIQDRWKMLKNLFLRLQKLKLAKKWAQKQGSHGSLMR